MYFVTPRFERTVLQRKNHSALANAPIYNGALKRLWMKTLNNNGQILSFKAIRLLVVNLVLV